MKRRTTSSLQVGPIKIGSEHPIVIQSMCNTPTTETEPTVAQIQRIVEAGADMVRTTVINVKEANNLQHIKEQLKNTNTPNVPLVADIHFNPEAAFIAAEHYDKVRINPGNFIDRRAIFKEVNYSEDEYQLELDKIEEKLSKLISLLKKHNTALRIGTNHGSLSDRIMTRYGNSPAGMVESTMEFLRVCRKYDFANLLISMKSSNPLIMVTAVRKLIANMEEENMHFPLHLGVTEAGEGEDGIIKSSVGLGALLSDGIGDTIRVSLTDEPENEIPVAKALVEYIASKKNYDEIQGKRLKNKALENLPAQAFKLATQAADMSNSKADFFFSYEPTGLDKVQLVAENSDFYPLTPENITDEKLQYLSQYPEKRILLEVDTEDNFFNAKSSLLALSELENQIYLSMVYDEESIFDLQVKASFDLGQIIIDKAVNGLSIRNKTPLENYDPEALVFDILQSGGMRVTKTEFVSCPGCGRTEYELQSTTKMIKKAIGYDTKFKIAVMGCIINGPGEMADADFGYVGSGKNKISLYRGQKCIKRNINQKEAVQLLVEEIQKAELERQQQENH